MKYVPCTMLCLPLACLVAQAESLDAPRDAQGRTPLMQVVLKCHRSGNADKALALIAGGADVNARDAAGNTPLMLISSIRYYNHEMRSSLAVIKALVEAGADVHALNPDGMNLLELAVCQKDMADAAVVEYLRSLGLELSLHGKLAEACANNDVAKVKQFLAAGADPNFARAFPLYICMSAGTNYQPHDEQIMALLLQAGANPNLRVRDLMRCCVHNGPSMHPLLDAGMDIHLAGPELSDFVALVWRTETAFPNTTFSRLLRLGADVNAPNSYGPLLCFSAEKWSRHDARRVAYLLSIGADPTLKDNKGRTALDIAREQGRQDIISMLEKPAAPHPITTPGVDVPESGRRRCGGTPLTEAAREGNVEKVKTLLAAGADIEALSDAWGGNTALWYALFKNHREVEKVLNQHYARFNKVGTSEFGITSVFHVAKGSAHLGGSLIRGEHGRIPLHEAVIRNDIERVGCDAWREEERKVVDDAGNTPMHYLSYGGSTRVESDVETARVLVKYGADLNARNAKGETPLHCIQGIGMEWIETTPSDALARYLISAGADVQARTNAGLNALELAVCLKSSWPMGSTNPVADSPNPIVRLLAAQGLSASQDALLIGAAAANDVAAVKRLLAAGANPNAFGKNAPNALSACLSTATEHCPHAYEIAKILLASGADPNLDATGIVFRACWSDLNMYELMFAHGLNLRNVPEPELRKLVARLYYWNYMKYYQTLVRHGAPEWDVARLAAEMRAAVLAADERAVYRVHNQFFPIQTPLPGTIPAPFADGNNTDGNALLLACALGHTDVVRILLCMECDVEGTDAAGRTPLEYAAANGYDDVVYLLINAGAKRISQAMQLAETYGYKHVSGILRQFIQP